VATISAAEARTFALAIIRGKCERGWSRESIATSMEGSTHHPAGCGYWMQSGQIHIGQFHDSQAPAFKITELFNEIDSPQRLLFG
jgi:hypothetical protein